MRDLLGKPEEWRSQKAQLAGEIRNHKNQPEDQKLTGMIEIV